MHGGSQLLGRSDAYVRLWTEVYDAYHDKNKPLLLKLLKEATAGFVAITDAPGNGFVEELLEIYPDAEVVLVERNRDSWWRSWEKVSSTAGQGFLSWFLMLSPGRRWWPKLVLQFYEQQEERFGAMSIERLDQHNAYVKRVTPKAKFHMMNLGQGWEPLCKILDKPIPREPFPRVNDADAVDKFVMQILRNAGLRWLALLGGLAVPAWVTWSYWPGI